MRAGRPVGLRGVTVVLTLAAAALVLAPMTAQASAPAREQSKKVVVTGKKLPVSGRIGTDSDPAIGRDVPVLSGQGFDGQTVKLDSTSPTPRLLLFVAHWCPHCRAEVPRIVKLASDGKLDGITVQTIATGTNKDYPNYPPSKWLAREEWPFTPVLADDSHQRALIAAGADAYPFFVFVDKDGKVAARASGELPPDTIATVAKNLADGKSPFAKA